MSTETKIDDGGPAFPTDHSRDSTYTNITGGMSLRDYFAAHIVPEAVRHELETRSGLIEPGKFRYDAIAQAAYDMADAMLKAREGSAE